MKQITFVLVLFCLRVVAFGQNADADKILGTYATEGNKGKIVIKKSGNKYNGTLTWTHIADATDKNNPDKTKRNNKLVGTEIVKDFIYAGNHVWEKGNVYDPESGKTYSGKISLNKDGNLDVRGFVGISAFGRTTVWTREK